MKFAHVVPEAQVMGELRGPQPLSECRSWACNCG